MKNNWMGCVLVFERRLYKDLIIFIRVLFIILKKNLNVFIVIFELIQFEKMIYLKVKVIYIVCGYLRNIYKLNF